MNNEKMRTGKLLAPLPQHIATRYITPLREGGSLPAVIEADDDRKYVMKFVGAGQGAKVLTAEVMAGAIAERIGLHLPEMTLLYLDPVMAQTERHEEIMDLLRASSGTNLGFRFLEQAFAYNPLLNPQPMEDVTASLIVWLDSYIMNVDRTSRNVNILIAGGKVWVIDHGAAFFFHHTWENLADRARSPFPFVREHTLLPIASELEEVDGLVRAQLEDDFLREVVELPPEEWLEYDDRIGDAAAQREAYFDFLRNRRDNSAIFVQEALRARASL